jgi:hypothetical protein
MHPTTHRIAVTAMLSLVAVSLIGAPQPPPGPIEFRSRLVEPKIPAGYALAVADMNKDGRPDIIGVSQRVPELAWYENPTWERHVMVTNMETPIYAALADIDGDGVPEAGFQSGFAMVPAKSEGLVWFLHHQGDPREPWTAQKIDQIPTAHHVAWADIDGDGRKELIHAPLIGAKGLGPTYDQDKVSLFWYRPGEWKRILIDDNINGIAHRVRAVRWDNNRREQLLAATNDGIALYRASGSGDNLKWSKQLLSPGHTADKAPRLGASDVAIGTIKGRRFMAAVEPWHGNEIVVYHESKPGNWERRVLFDGMTEGHEVALADFNGDGRDDIVAGDRSAKSPALHVMYAPADPVAGEWQHQVLDAGGMAGSGVAVADFNGDRRMDIAAIGNSTGNIKWYENLGVAAAAK